MALNIAKRLSNSIPFNRKSFMESSLLSGHDKNTSFKLQIGSKQDFFIGAFLNARTKASTICLTLSDLAGRGKQKTSRLFTAAVAQLSFDFGLFEVSAKDCKKDTIMFDCSGGNSFPLVTQQS